MLTLQVGSPMLLPQMQTCERVEFDDITAVASEHRPLSPILL